MIRKLNYKHKIKIVINAFIFELMFINYVIEVGISIDI